MATTQMLTGNALTVKRWEMQGWVEAHQQSAFGHLFNRGAVYFPEEFLGKDNLGDTVTYHYTGKMTSIPVGEGGTLTGNETALDLGNFSMTMNESRDAVKFPNRGIEPQRSKVDFERTARVLIPKRVSELMDTGAFQQLAGVNPTSFTMNGTTYATSAAKLHVQGHNTPVAPTANRIVRAGGHSDDQSITSSDTMTLPLIDYALELNATSDQPIETFADGTFDLYLSPYDIVNLKHDTSGAVKWYTNELSALEGGSDETIRDMYKNSVKMRCLGKYANVNIYEAGRVACGANSSSSAAITTVKRNVLVGMDALSYASPYGGRPSDDDVPLKIINELQDYDKYKGVGFELVYGCKKNSPSNGEDIGSMVIATYAAAHT